MEEFNVNRRQSITLVAGSKLFWLADGANAAIESYQNRLYTPTQIVKLYGTYFIVDCWHHRILCAKNVNLPIAQWDVMDANLAGPHSIASDGNHYVTEDTGRHAIKVYKKNSNNKFEIFQTIANIGIRPHRVRYDTNHHQFIIIGSVDQSIHFVAVQNNKLKLQKSLIIHELRGQYSRSITIAGNFLYIVGSYNILCFELRQGMLGKLIRNVKLHESYHGGVDIFFNSDRSGFFTAVEKKFISFRKLLDLELGTGRNLSRKFSGTPYYIEKFDQKIWIPEISNYSAISSSHIVNNNLGKLNRQFNFGSPIEASTRRKNAFPT